KDDIGNVYAVSHLNPSNQSEVFFGLERMINNGSSHDDFEFLQQPLSLVPQPTSADPCAGSVSGHRTKGDVLAVADFNTGGSLGATSIWLWTCTGSLSESSTTYPIGMTCDPSNTLRNAQYIQVPASDTRSNSFLLHVNALAAPIKCGGWV